MMGYHFTPVGMTEIKKKKMTIPSEVRVWSKWSSHIAGGNVKWHLAVSYKV